MKLLVFLATLCVLCTPSLADTDDLIGTWRLDLRPTPDAEPYYETLVIRSITDSTVTGSFYGTEFTNGKINTTWNDIEIAFVTEDGSGVYHTSAALRNGRLEGRTHALGRDFLMPWRAIPAYPTKTLSPEGARTDLALLRSALERIHPGLNRYTEQSVLDAQFDALLETYADGGDALDLYRDVSVLAGLIRCGHTRVEGPVAYDAYRADVPTHLPFHFRLMDGRMWVMAAAPDAPSLVRGTEILAINGISVEDLVEQIGATVPIDGMTDHIRPSRLDTSYEYADTGFDHYLPLFLGMRDDFLLDCMTSDGETFQTNVRAITPGAWRALVPKGATNFADSISVERIDDDTRLLRVGSFINYRNVVDASAHLRPIFMAFNDEQVKHLIIDLRSNGGGSSDAAWALAEYLIEEPIPFKNPLVKNYSFDDALKQHLSTWDAQALNMPDAAFKTRDDGWYELMPWASGRAAQLTPSVDRFKGAVTMLTGPYNASGSTMLLATLKDAGRVRLVGMPTGGSAEGPTAGILFTLTLPNSGIRINIPGLFERSPVSSFDAGLGVQPDVEVPMTVDDLLQQRDPVLDAALRAR